jgi:hypothetical protein
MKRLTAQARLITRLGLFVFLWSTAYAQITPSGDSYTNTAGPSINYLSRTMFSYFAAIELAFTILVALACAAVLALVGIYISNQAHSLKNCRPEQNRSSLNFVQPSIRPSRSLNSGLLSLNSPIR